MVFCVAGIGARLKSLLMISRKSFNKKPSQNQRQRAVRALAWVLAGKLANFGFTFEYLALDLVLVEVEVIFSAEF